MKPIAAFAVLFLVSACTTTPDAPPAGPSPSEPAQAAPKPVPPRAKPAPPPAPKEAEAPPPVVVETAPDLLRKGVARYDDGDYREAESQFAAALELGLAQPADQATARKHLAFMACVSARLSECRAQFRRAFEAHPAFELTPAEAGHPTWGPVFRSVKAEVAKKKRAPATKSKASPSKPKAKPSPPAAPR